VPAELGKPEHMELEVGWDEVTGPFNIPVLK
jgi:hypothetical protein